MAYEFRMQRIVEFADTDMAGILHFSNYFRYMEETEHAFFRSLGLSVHTASEAGAWGAARRRAECSYRQPLRYEDVVELHLLVQEKRTRSISYQIVFRRSGSARGGFDASRPVPASDLTEVARGSLTVVFVRKPEDGDGPLAAVAIPREVDALIESAPPELLA